MALQIFEDERKAAMFGKPGDADQDAFPGFDVLTGGLVDLVTDVS